MVLMDSAAVKMEDDVSQLRALAKDAYEQAGSKLGLTDMKELLAQGMLLLLKLKEDNRVATFQAEAQKDETAKHKAALEACDLQLQNLVYEKQYYEKEIRNNRNFTSRYTEEQLGLDPPEAFLAEMPPGVAAKAVADQHAFMLARLQRELQQRKEMARRLQDVQAQKAAVVAQKDARRRVLDDLATQLRALEEHARPLRAILAPPAASLAVFSHAANLLPLPLYLIYSQLAAAKEALALAVRVTITGVTADAEAFAAHAAAALNGKDSAPTGSSGVAAAASPSAAANGAAATGGAAESGPAAGLAATRLADVPVSSSGGGGSRSKRAKLAVAGQEEGPYKAHPLTVVLEVLRSSSSSSSASTAAAAATAPALMPPPTPRPFSSTLLAVKFQFLVNLKLVTAHSDVPGDNALLAQLYPLDEGGAETFEAASQALGGTFSYDATRAQKPYRWCQQLGGLDFVPPLPLGTMLQGPDVEAALKGLELYRREQRVVALVQRLTEVKEQKLADGVESK